MKKKLILLCVICLLVSALAVNANAADDPTLTVVSDSSVNVGGTFTVTLDIANNPGIVSGGLEIEYDSAKLKVTSGTSTLPNGQVNTNIAGSVVVSFAGSENHTANGSIVTLTFQVLDGAAAGDTTITPKLNDSDPMTHLKEDYSGETVNFTVASKTISIAAHTHTMGAKIPGKPATCKEDGVKDTWTCSGCGKTFIDEAGTTEATDANKVIDKSTVPHTIVPVKGTPATCTTDGTKDHFKCSVCDKLFSDAAGTTEIAAPEVLPKGNHGGTTVPAKAATCEKEGNIAYYVCNGCGKYFQDGTQTEITQGAAGTVTPKVAHTTTAKPAVAATCTTKGNKAYNECTVCHKMFADANAPANATALTEAEVFIDPIDHTWDESKTVAGKDATKEATGLREVKTCSVCGKEYVQIDGKWVEKTAENVVIPKLPADKPADKNNGKSPKTGDETNIALWVSLFVLCAAVAAITVVVTRKTRKN